MKNKARCNYLKKIFACCVLAFLLISISVPCFATSVYPTQNNRFSSRRMLYPSDGWTYDNCIAIADVVEKAYKLNYFSSGIPVAVFTVFDSIGVLVVPHVFLTENVTPIPGATYDGATPPLTGVSRASVYCDLEEEIADSLLVNISAKQSESGITYPMTLYFLNDDNTFFPAYAVPLLVDYNQQSPTESDFELAVGMVTSFQYYKRDVLAVRYGEGDWRTPYANGYSDIDLELGVLDEWYDDHLEGVTVENNFNYELDIPSIITAIPNGARQIINNVFGFELFGINVAGLLSVLLIVSIVGFVIKKLIK